MSVESLLEYLAFGGSLCSAWFYGRHGIKGPIAGLLTAIAFIAFGYVAEVYAALASNLIFLFVHTRNLKIVLGETH